MRCSVIVTSGLLITASFGFAQSSPGKMPPAAGPAAATLPASPSGRSTVMGGEIEKIDMVRDQLSLKIAGGHTVKILFDERTQVYRNGKKIALPDLHPADHASVETTLDGTAIFALRIHMLSGLPDGQVEGKVVSYDGATGELKVHVASSKDLLKFIAPATTPMARVGEAPFAEQKSGAADLIPGTLVAVTFKSGTVGTGMATRIDVRAVPGAEFVFQGTITSLDLRKGRLSIENNTERPTDISFAPALFSSSHDLHQGSSVRVSAHFDGNHYVASSISVE